MDKEERRAAEAERLMEAFSDYLDGVSAEDFDRLEAERWLAASEELDGAEGSFDAAAAEAAFRARHGALLDREAPAEKKGKVVRLRRLLPRVAGVAAAAVLVVALAAQGMGLDLFRHVASWTRGEFTFTTGTGELPAGPSTPTGRRRWTPMTSGCPCCPPGTPPGRGMKSPGWT